VKRLPLSRAGAGLVRTLVARGQDKDNRIFLREIRSEDWQSLVFTGERHLVSLGIAGPDAARAANLLCERLADAEFEIAGTIVADISAGRPRPEADGSILVEIEALTIDE
jgi:hypothetical protein